MRFFQVTVTNRFKNFMDRMYTSVYNYASLAEAMRDIRLFENKNAEDGVSYTDDHGREVVQFHLVYEENGCAVIELRHEYFGIPEDSTVEQVIYQESVYVKEIVL